jgi:lauroyl/myristoyl acyltransferase
VTTSPLAPYRGRIARLLGPLQATGVFWYRLPWTLVRVLPEPLLRAVLAFVVMGAYVVLPRIRRAIAQNQAVILGKAAFFARQRRVLRTLGVFSLVMAERWERLRGRPFTAEFEGLENWQQATSSGRGFVLITAHLGCWEAGSLLPQGQQDKVVHLVREPELDPRAQRFLAHQMERQQGRTVTHFATDDATLGVELLQALRRGEVVALQADRPRAGQAARSVQLFGRTVALPHGPAALARAASVPLLPVFVYHVRRRHYRVVLRPPIEVSSGTDRDADPAAAATATRISMRPWPASPVNWKARSAARRSSGSASRRSSPRLRLQEEADGSLQQEPGLVPQGNGIDRQCASAALAFDLDAQLRVHRQRRGQQFDRLHAYQVAASRSDSLLQAGVVADRLRAQFQAGERRAGATLRERAGGGHAADREQAMRFQLQHRFEPQRVAAMGQHRRRRGERFSHCRLRRVGRCRSPPARPQPSPCGTAPSLPGP